MSEKIDFSKLQRFIKKMKNLHPNAPENEIREQAERALIESERLRDLDIDSMFLDSDERQHGKSLLKKYLGDYVIETVSDRNTLRQLIYLEVLNYRLQAQLNRDYEKDKSIGKDSLQMIHQNQDKILMIKSKLGITRDKDGDNVKDGFGYLQLIKRKYRKWLNENQASRTVCCPYCSKLFFLKIKMDYWIAQKHPFFKDRFLGNEHLISLYKCGKLTREDVAKVFNTSLDYIDLLVTKGWGLSLDETQKQTSGGNVNEKVT